MTMECNTCGATGRFDWPKEEPCGSCGHPPDLPRPYGWNVLTGDEVEALKRAMDFFCDCRCGFNVHEPKCVLGYAAVEKLAKRVAK